MVSKDYDEVRDFAQKRANKTGLSQGIEKISSYAGGPRDAFKAFFLPSASKRFGYELRCEAVEPEVTR